MSVITFLRKKHTTSYVLKFELDDKPDELLARQLRGVQVQRAIHKISNPFGKFITKPKLIKINTCIYYYTQLYSYKSNASDSEIGCFLDSLNFPTPNETAQQDMN